MKTGLYFGSFNPVHIGHLAIANYMIEFTDLDQLWFVISPLNPLKKQASLLEDHKRRSMLEIAVENDDRFRVCDIEFRMPKPSYTIDTLTWLKELHPATEFVLIMGSDGLPTFQKWKNYKIIEAQYKRYIYPRPGYPVEPDKHPNILIADAPQMEISSTFIREALRSKHDIRHFLPGRVYEYITQMHYYEDKSSI
ncbi:MAG: nicotinate-nucleotide adenylyltransferase [Bacteroidales bacterium]|nr:nicotinate-nucleotide adenylyltransferase [Bacteroidales bacterium]